MFIAQSLDGYIAKSDDDIAWLDSVPELDDNFDFGYGELFASVDALVFGRRTYQKVTSFPEWPYGQKKIYVMSNSVESSSSEDRNVSFSAESPGNLVRRLSDEGCRHLYIDGGRLIQSFLQEDLIDDLNISTIPVLLGGGISLFGLLANEVWLDLIESNAYPNGMVQTRYKLNRTDASQA